jgi:hypothetical protein
MEWKGCKDFFELIRLGRAGIRAGLLLLLYLGDVRGYVWVVFDSTRRGLDVDELQHLYPPQTSPHNLLIIYSIVCVDRTFDVSQAGRLVKESHDC